MTPQEKLAQQIQVLEELDALDRVLTRLETQIKEGQGVLDGLRGELGQFDARIASERRSLEEMQQTAGELSVESRQMLSQVEKAREKASRARNDREAVAAEREQEELRRMQRDREEEVTKLRGLIEQAQKSAADLTAKRDKVASELGASEGSTTSQLGEVRQERETRLAARSELTAKLPAPLLKRYENTRKKKGVALARATDDGTCGACHVSLPPPFFHKVMRREAIEECPMCHRLLYYRPESSS